MKFITALAFVFCFASSLMAFPKYVTVDFASEGGGINFELYGEITEILKVEKKFGNVKEIEKNSDVIPFEGEVQLCISSDRDNMNRLSSVFEILSRNDRTTSVGWSHTCGDSAPLCPVLVLPPGDNCYVETNDLGCDIWICK